MKRKLTAALIVLLAVCQAFWVSGCAGPEPAYDNSVVTPSPPPPGYTPTPEASNTPLEAPGVGITVEKIAPCVVTILTEWVDYSYFLQPTPYRGAGSGVIFTQDGYIVTNGHVVENAKDIKVILPDGSFFLASLVGVDPFTDLAVIKVDAHSLPVANFGDSEALHLGQPVIAIGNAFDLPGGHTVTLGIVSALGRSIKTSDGIILHDLIQTDAAINPGNSGGPLLTLDGKVIGINTARIGGGAENIGFAVSSATIEPVIEQLVRHGTVVGTVDTVLRSLVLRLELLLDLVYCFADVFVGPLEVDWGTPMTFINEDIRSENAVNGEFGNSDIVAIFGVISHDLSLGTGMIQFREDMAGGRDELLSVELCIFSFLDNVLYVGLD